MRQDFKTKLGVIGNIFTILIAISILSLSFVIADHVITISGGTSITVNEDVTNFYNISVNISDVGYSANVSQVNITLWGDFTFLSDSNGSDAREGTGKNFSFSNTSTVLSWQNLTDYINNGSRRNYFWFNATATTPGTYNMTVSTLNGTEFLSTNLTITVNDTTLPDISTILANNTSSSVVGLDINYTYSDNGVKDSCWYSNDTMTLNTTLTNCANITSVNWSEGRHNVTIWINDSFNNVNKTDLQFIIDVTNPGITISLDSRGQGSIELSIALSDSLSGISEACSSSRTTATVTGSGTSQTLTESGLSCGSSYTYTLTCNDAAGNSGQASESFSTLGCDSQTTGGGGGITWTTTHVVNNEQFEEGFTKELEVNKRFKIQIQDEDHYIGLKDLDSTKATILVFSTSQEAILKVGETKNFDVLGDEYYDLTVTLNSINNDKAEFTIKAIREKVVEDVTGEAKEQTAPSTEEELPAERGNLMWLWIVITVIVVAAIVFYFMKMRR